MVVRLLALLLALGACPACRGAAADPAPASEVLLEFAAAARGDDAAALPDWRAGTDPCTWSGVGCSERGAIVSLRLPNAGLRGTLDPLLYRLATLRQIDLRGNALRGRLPNRWARLDALERLLLDRNQLSGPLPPSWNTLEELKYLSLAGNALNGSLPVAWASLGQLYLLDLSGNRLEGPLPGAWSRQRWLFRLSLARNALVGPLPPQWGRLRGLLQLDLGGNQLTGSLPPQWGELRQATAVDLAANRLSGPLPPQWGGLASLQVLALQGNRLSGVVPTQWAALADRAYRLSLGGNPQLCGTVPQPLATPVLAAGASAAGSRLGVPCPWQADADALLAFKAILVGAPAGALADWSPDAGNPCSEAAWTGVSCRGGRVAALDLAGQGLRLSSLEPLGQLAALQKVLLGGNSATNASLPASWARGLPQLAVVDLSGADVGGTLPEAWGALSGLKQLRLRGNSLSGGLPASWAALGSLAELDLSQNALTGGLPPEWGMLPALASLDASSNYLTGGLPEGWGALGQAQELRLASNNLGGAIPAAWARLPSLTLLDLGSNVGLCGNPPAWRTGMQVRTEATSLGQSCILVQTSGAMAGVVLGVSLSATLASLAAAGAMLVYLRRQRSQLAVLQRERSAANLSALPSFDSGSLPGVPYGSKAGHQLHTFSAGDGELRAGGKAPKPLSIPSPWADQQGGGYIQVPLVTPLATPHSSLPVGLGRTPPRGFAPPPPVDEHRSPSPVAGMPSPERHLWQVQAQAADRGTDLTARRARQKRLFRSRSDAPVSLAVVAGDLQQQQQRAGEASEEAELEMARAHSRMQLLPPDSGMV